MTAIISATLPAARRAVIVGSAEVTFTPYVIRKVGEVRTVTLDGAETKAIYNDRRGLTYFVMKIDGVETTGRIAAELVDGGVYESVTKATRVVPPAGKKAPKAVAEVVPVAEAAPVAKKARKPKD